MSDSFISLEKIPPVGCPMYVIKMCAFELILSKYVLVENLSANNFPACFMEVSNYNVPAFCPNK